MLVQKGFESDPVAAWTKAQEKVLDTHSGHNVHPNGRVCSVTVNSNRLRRKTTGTRATLRWILVPRQDQTSTTSSTCLCGA